MSAQHLAEFRIIGAMGEGRDFTYGDNNKSGYAFDIQVGNDTHELKVFGRAIDECSAISPGTLVEIIGTIKPVWREGKGNYAGKRFYNMSPWDIKLTVLDATAPAADGGEDTPF